MCSIDRCVDTKIMALGLCTKHYKRQYKYGDPMYMKNLEFLVDYCKDCRIFQDKIVLCNKHIKTRDALDFGTKDDVFWTYVGIKDDKDSCWEWELGYKNVGNYRYGYWDSGKSYGTKIAHRISYIICNKVQLNSYQVVHHVCSNSACQNPNHLQLTNQQDNLAEMFARNEFLKKIEELEDRRNKLVEVISDSYTPEKGVLL